MAEPRARSRRWQFRIWIVALAAAVAGLWFGPRLVDWSPLKPDIAEIISDQLGVDVAIHGGLQIQFLPQPRITAGDIRVQGDRVNGEIRWLRGNLDPTALLTGKFMPRNVELVEADLTLPISASGSDHYEAETSVAIQGARLTLTGGPDWLPSQLEKMHGRLTLGGRLGRFFAFDGEARLAGEPVGLSVEGHTGGAFVLSVAHGPSASDLALQGGPTQDGNWAGRATIVLEEAGFLSTLNADPLARLLGEGPATLDAALRTTGAGVLAIDIEALESANLSGQGNATLVQGNRPALDLSLELDEVYLASDHIAARSLSKDLAHSLEEFSAIDLSLTLAARTVQTMIGPIKALRLSLAAGGGIAIIDQASAILPGDSDLSLFGTLRPDKDSWRFDGEAGIAARDIRAGLSAVFPDIAAPLANLPADRLRRIDLTARILAEPSHLEILELTGRVDETQLAGAFSLGPNRSIEAVLQGDRLNLSRYMGEDGLAVFAPPILSALQSRDLDQRLSLFFDRLSIDGIPAEEVAMEMAQDQGTFAMGLTVGNLAGASGSAELALTGITIAQASIHLNVPKPDRFLGALGLSAKRAAAAASFGETAVTLDLSLTPDKGIGYALEGIGSGGDFRANGLFLADPTPIVSVTDGAFNLGDLTLFDLSGLCTSDGLGGWNCGDVGGAMPGFQVSGDIWIEPILAAIESEPLRRVHVDLSGAEMDLGLFLTRTGLPILPEGLAVFAGPLQGEGTDLEAAFSALQGQLTLGGEASLHVRPGGGGRLGNLDRLRRNLETAFGEPASLAGEITITPQEFTSSLSLQGQGAVLTSTASLSRLGHHLSTRIEIREGRTAAPALTFNADGPADAPGIRLSGPWASGR